MGVRVEEGKLTNLLPDLAHSTTNYNQASSQGAGVGELEFLLVAEAVVGMVVDVEVEVEVGAVDRDRNDTRSGILAVTPN